MKVEKIPTDYTVRVTLSRYEAKALRAELGHLIKYYNIPIAVCLFLQTVTLADELRIQGVE